MKLLQNRLKATLTTKLTALCGVFVLGLGIVAITAWLSANRLGNFIRSNLSQRPLSYFSRCQCVGVFHGPGYC